MSSKCNPILEESVSKLLASFRVTNQDDECSLVTPFQYPDGSPIAISLNETVDGEFFLSDNGEAADFAFLGGVSEGSIRERLKLIEKRYPVSTKGQEITVSTSTAELSSAILALIGSIQDASYLVYRQSTQPKRRNFKAQVEQFLASSSWPFEKDVLVISEPVPRKVNYVVHGRGASQLYLFTYEPPAATQADRQLDPILVTTQELVNRNLIGRHSQLAVLVETGPTEETHQRARAALTMMESWHVPNLISWDQRDRLSDLLMAA